MNNKLLISKFMDGGSVYDNASSSMQDDSASYPGPGRRSKGNKRRARRAKKKCGRKGCGSKVKYRVR